MIERLALSRYKSGTLGFSSGSSNSGGSFNGSNSGNITGGTYGTTSSGTGVVTPPNGTKKYRRRKLNIEAVKEALLKTNQNRLEAAKLLGVSRATFYRFLDDTGIVN